MKHLLDDTIAAIITPVGVGGVGIIRISGASSINILCKLFSPYKPSATWLSHMLYLGWIVKGPNSTRIDQVLAVVMRGPRSYTGEDCVEIHCHGGLITQKMILDLIIQQGARMADPGEFTKRAYLHGRVGLSQAEAIIDIVNAKSEQSLFTATEMLSGCLKNKIDHFRDELLNLLSASEAHNDFPDDVDGDGDDLSLDKIRVMVSEISQLISSQDLGRMLREGIRIAIVGKPNVGKSSLLNALLGENRAIVTDLPGTTRDTIVETINIAGMPFIVIDTAGIRKPKDIVEQIGVERAKAEMDQADIILIVIDTSLPIDSEDRVVLSEANANSSIIVYNKIDLPLGLDYSDIQAGLASVKVSVLKGDGLMELSESIRNLAFNYERTNKHSRVAINARQMECLFRAREALERMLQASSEGAFASSIAIELRTAIEALGELEGAGISDEIANRIFSRFCIGK